MVFALTLQDIGIGVGVAAALVSIWVGVVTLLDRRQRGNAPPSLLSERQELAQEVAVALVDAGHALGSLQLWLDKGLAACRKPPFEAPTEHVREKRSSLEPILARVRVVFGDGDAADALANACAAMVQVEFALRSIARLRDPDDAPDHVVPSLKFLFDSQRRTIDEEQKRFEIAAADFARAVSSRR